MPSVMQSRAPLLLDGCLRCVWEEVKLKARDVALSVFAVLGVDLPLRRATHHPRVSTRRKRGGHKATVDERLLVGSCSHVVALLDEPALLHGLIEGLGADMLGHSLVELLSNRAAAHAPRHSASVAVEREVLAWRRWFV